MPKEKISTSALLRKLFKTANLESFIKHHSEQFDTVPFHTYINQLCAETGTIPAHVINKSGIERTFGHQLFNGIRKPSRDKVIQLAFGFVMDYEQTQELLKISRHRALYPKIKRDAVIIFALNRGLPVTDVQVTLSELSLPLLGKEERYE